MLRGRVDPGGGAPRPPRVPPPLGHPQQPHIVLGGSESGGDIGPSSSILREVIHDFIYYFFVNFVEQEMLGSRVHPGFVVCREECSPCWL